MSVYTTTLKRAIEMVGGTINLDGPYPVMTGDIGLNTYPIFDEAYRARLNGAFLGKFINREIGVETVGMFRHYLKHHMFLNMPMFNQMYEANRLNFDPLKTIDLRTIATGTAAQQSTESATNETESDNESLSRVINSDFPQTQLSGNADYASSGADSNSQAKSTANVQTDSESASNANTSNDSHVTGYQGIPSDLIVAYRESLINVDSLVLDSCETLFMQVWESNDTYTSKGYYYGY